MRYRDAGVDIDAGNQLVERIGPHAQKTRRPEVLSKLGGFASAVAIPKGYNEPLLVSSTDGVGTKLKIAFATGKHDTVGIDLVAMNVDDIVVVGAEPLFFLDYFACGKLDVNVAEAVIAGIAEGCKQAGCALVGGETAEMPGFYPEGEYDLAGFAVGVVEKENTIDGSKLAPGDVVIGLASSGLHSNGYSLARRVLIETAKLRLDEHVPALGKTLGDELLIPTKIYAKSLLALHKQGLMLGAAHITGGGLIENPPRMLKPNRAFILRKQALPKTALFPLIAERGKVPADEMLRTFNMGVGMVVAVPARSADAALALLQSQGEQAFFLGEIAVRKDSAVELVD